jgi:hypothetical protein
MILLTTRTSQSSHRKTRPCNISSNQGAYLGFVDRRFEELTRELPGKRDRSAQHRLWQTIDCMG